MEAKSYDREQFVTEDHAKLLIRITQKIIADTFQIEAIHQGTIFTEGTFPAADVSGIVSITQESMNGTLAFLFPLATLNGLISKIYRIPPPNPEKSTAAAVGEICNMVFGNMKTELNGGPMKHSIKMALPNVVLGPQHQILTFLQGKKFIASFDCTFGSFQMGVTASNG